jgi:hypothetical protein
MVRIKLTDIEYIEGCVDYIKIHMINEKPLPTLMTFKAMMEKLPANNLGEYNKVIMFLFQK